MTITTYEGVVEKGKIRLKASVRLPENTRVLIVVAEAQPKKTVRVVSPHLVHQKQAADFKMAVSEQKADA